MCPCACVCVNINLCKVFNIPPLPHSQGSINTRCGGFRGHSMVILIRIIFSIFGNLFGIILKLFGRIIFWEVSILFNFVIYFSLIDVHLGIFFPLLFVCMYVHVCISVYMCVYVCVLRFFFSAIWLFFPLNSTLQKPPQVNFFNPNLPLVVHKVLAP